MKTTVLAAAALALVTVLPAVLVVTVLPTSVQQNQCATENDGNEFPEGVIVDENGECKIIGNDLDIE
jgi:hypothetical protein